MRFLVLAFLLSACGTEHFPHSRSPVLDLGEFKYYIEQFEFDAYRYGRSLIINDLVVEFADIESPYEDRVILGKCRSGDSQRPPRIQIDREHWPKLNSIHKEILMYHELGHCILNRGHIDEVSSIMNTFLLSWYAYDTNEFYYLNELFNPSPSTSLHGHNEDEPCQ